MNWRRRLLQPVSKGRSRDSGGGCEKCWRLKQSICAKTVRRAKQGPCEIAFQSRNERLACPIICTGGIVSVAQREREIIARRRSRRCGKVESVVCFPLFHTAGKL